MNIIKSFARLLIVLSMITASVVAQATKPNDPKFPPNLPEPVPVPKAGEAKPPIGKGGQDLLADEARSNVTSIFYNEDVPNAVASLKIQYIGLPDAQGKKVDLWYKEITEKIHKHGGVNNEADEDWVLRNMIGVHIKPFFDTGVMRVLVIFPRSDRVVEVGLEKPKPAK